MRKSGVMLVGLCGRSGSGKGYVSAMFKDEGIPSIDTDAVYRELTSAAPSMSECMAELAAHFGGEVANDDNSLNRQAMRNIVFSGNKDALAALNSITHKHILGKTQQIAEEFFLCGYNIVLVDAPVLYESGFDKKCECVVCVTAPEDTVITRIMNRDGITYEEATRRLKTQISAEELAAKADFEIKNDCSKEELRRRVLACTEELRRIYNKKYETCEV